LANLVQISLWLCPSSKVVLVTSHFTVIMSLPYVVLPLIALTAGKFINEIAEAKVIIVENSHPQQDFV